VYEYDATSPTYTVLAHPTPDVMTLLDDMKSHHVNYVFIDKSAFSPEEVLSLFSFYRDLVINDGYESDRTADDDEEDDDDDFLYYRAHVFIEDKFLVGGLFEMYEMLWRALP
jgi:hypothetical protein